MQKTNHMVSTSTITGEEEEQRLLQSLFDSSVNFDEVIPEPVIVSLVDYIEYEATLGDQKVIRRKPVIRKAEIGTYVPMKILHRMMSSQEKIRKIQAIRSTKNGQMDGQTQQEMMDWMTEQVVNVWKLTEPDMTTDRLQESLDFRKIFGLFNLFFGNLLTGQNK